MMPGFANLECLEERVLLASTPVFPNVPMDLMPHGVVAADFNRDGMPDLATANAAGDTVSVCLGNGDGTFQARTDYAAGASPRYLTAADLNGDGTLDLATANVNGGTVSVFLGNANGTFQAKVDYTAGIDPNSVVAADVNRDGKPDLVVANRNGGNVSIFLGNGDGTFQLATNEGGDGVPVTPEGHKRWTEGWLWRPTEFRRR